MAQYTVKITIDPFWVDQFNKGGYALIMAKGVGSPDSPDITYNVVAQTYGNNGNVMPTMDIQWTDTYQLAGTQQVFQDGVQIEGYSDQLSAPFGNSYYLNSWSDSSVEPDSTAPTNGWRFVNKIGASSVVLLDVNGSYTPVYVSPTELPPGGQSLIPKPQVCFWFANDIETSTMVTIDKSIVGTVNLPSTAPVNVQYTRDGSWKVLASKTKVNYIDLAEKKSGKKHPAHQKAAGHAC